MADDCVKLRLTDNFWTAQRAPLNFSRPIAFQRYIPNASFHLRCGSPIGHSGLVSPFPSDDACRCPWRERLEVIFLTILHYRASTCFMSFVCIYLSSSQYSATAHPSVHQIHILGTGKLWAIGRVYTILTIGTFTKLQHFFLPEVLWDLLSKTGNRSKESTWCCYGVTLIVSTFQRNTSVRLKGSLCEVECKYLVAQ
jgi:hypothetical protein